MTGGLENDSQGRFQPFAKPSSHNQPRCAEVSCARRRKRVGSSRSCIGRGAGGGGGNGWGFGTLKLQPPSSWFSISGACNSSSMICARECKPPYGRFEGQPNFSLPHSLACGDRDPALQALHGAAPPDHGCASRRCGAMLHEEPLKAQKNQKFQGFGWGTWIRTKAARVRAGSSTAKLSPKRVRHWPGPRI